MYRSMIEGPGLGSDVGQLVVSLFSALHMLSELLPWDNSTGLAPLFTHRNDTRLENHAAGWRGNLQSPRVGP